VHLIDELKVGGAQTHLSTILRESLNTYPVKHRVISIFGDGPIGDEIRNLGIEVDVLELRPFLEKKNVLNAASVLRRMFKYTQPDLVEAHLTWSRLLGLYAAWQVNIPYRIGFEQGDVYLNSWKFRIGNFIGQYFADHIIVCSYALADWINRTHYISHDRIAVIHNCVDTKMFKQTEKKCSKEVLGLPNNLTVFCAVGSLGIGVNKRNDVCIRAIKTARSYGANIGLVICGDGDQRNNLETLVTELKLESYVRFLGWRNDINSIMNICDGFCHAAPFEPFGIVCIEAMASGLPVIVPDKGGIQEAVKDGVTGILYPALNYNALADAMCRLHLNPTMRREMGRVARREAEERFSVQQYVKRLYLLYSAIEHDGVEKIF